MGVNSEPELESEVGTAVGLASGPDGITWLSLSAGPPSLMPGLCPQTVQSQQYSMMSAMKSELWAACSGMVCIYQMYLPILSLLRS